MRVFLIMVLAFSVSTIWAGDKEKQSKKTDKKPVKVEQLYIEDKGKPEDPGSQGRANAANKKAANPGKGSGKTKDFEVTPLNEKSDQGDGKETGRKKKGGDNPE